MVCSCSDLEYCDRVTYSCAPCREICHGRPRSSSDCQRRCPKYFTSTGTTTTTVKLLGTAAPLVNQVVTSDVSLNWIILMGVMTGLIVILLVVLSFICIRVFPSKHTNTCIEKGRHGSGSSNEPMLIDEEKKIDGKQPESRPNEHTYSCIPTILGTGPSKDPLNPTYCNGSVANGIEKH